jgi:hypothetical protein
MMTIAQCRKMELEVWERCIERVVWLRQVNVIACRCMVDIMRRMNQH